MKLSLRMLCFIAVQLCFVLPLYSQQALIREETRSIKTYPFSDPDPVPMLAKNPRIYPYFAFDGFSATGKMQNWKIVKLENAYVEVFVLPEVGGKVLGAREKSTQKEFIYMNDALKFRRIALRGPWTSGGIEFNFGIIGHTPSTATPVDYALRTNSDGSVTCFVGTMDLPSRTRWTVAINLPKDKAFVETRPLWYNPSPFEQSYYTWITAAVSAREDLEYFYPGRYSVPHSYDVANAGWPLDKNGRDLSWYKNNRFESHKSYFVFGEYRNFFGTYFHELRLGLGHWANYDDMPGQKVWIWSLFRDGAVWEKLLTDNKGQYSEPQAGRLFSQVDHEFFPPYTGDQWSELWFPIKEIGGVVAASPYAALNVQQVGDSVQIGICALQSLDDDLLVQSGENEILRERVTLKPMQVYHRNLKRRQLEAALKIMLSDKLQYTNAPHANDLQRPIVYQPVAESTPEGLYLAGEFYEKQRAYETAMQKYSACLHRDANHIRAMTRLAVLHGRRGEYEKGRSYAEQALRLRMYDPEANYVYGVLSRRMGQLVEAKETLGWAARAMTYRANAYCQLAEIYLLEKNYAAAVEYAQRALDFNKFNVSAYEILAATYRRYGQPEQAQSVLRQLEALDPLNHFIRFERYWLEPTAERLADFKNMIRNEFPHETYLELACNYEKLGLVEEATTLLQLGPPHPQLNYWRAYLLRETDRAQSAALLEQAMAFSPELVFPFREEEIPVLQWAMQSQPANWKFKYYLGLIYWAKDRKEEALQLFNACGTPDFAYFYLARAELQKALGNKAVLPDLQQAVAMKPQAWRTWHALANYHNQARQFEPALKLSQQAAKKFPNEIVPAMDHASALFNNGRYAECLLALRKMNVLPYEGSWEAHDLFLRANVYLAMTKMRRKDYAQALAYLEKSQAYPEALGTGAPDEPDFRLQDYLSSVCHEKLGQATRANEARQRIADYTLRHGMEWGSAHYFGILALQQTGAPDKANQLWRDWQARSPNDARVQWVAARFAGEQAKAAAIEQSHWDDAHLQMQAEAAKLTEQ